MASPADEYGWESACNSLETPRNQGLPLSTGTALILLISDAMHFLALDPH